MSRRSWARPARSPPTPIWPTTPTKIVIIYADNLSDVDLRPLIAFHRRHGDPLTMVLFRAPDPRACGIAELDREGRIVSFVEKPEQPAQRPGQRRAVRCRCRGLSRDRRDGGVRPGLRRASSVRGPDARLGLGGVLPRYRHPRGPRARRREAAPILPDQFASR